MIEIHGIDNFLGILLDLPNCTTNGVCCCVCCDGDSLAFACNTVSVASRLLDPAACLPVNEMGCEYLTGVILSNALSTSSSVNVLNSISFVFD